MKKLIAIFLLISLFGCEQRCNHKKGYKQNVKCYKTHSVDNTGNDIWLYYYLFASSNNQNYYYYSSPTPITSYSGVNWQTSNVNPVSAYDEKQIEQMPEQEVAVQDMNPEMQEQMTENPENFEGMTQDEMGDYEGGTENSSDNSSSDAGSDAGSSDGGGDSGGGDGGGGGE